MAEEHSIDRFISQPRLPKSAIPRRYDLFLRPDFDSCKFSGAVEIVVDVVEDTKFLVLNAADLSIDRDSVWFKSQISTQVYPASAWCKLCSLYLFKWFNWILEVLGLSQEVTLAETFPAEVVLVEDDEILVLRFDECLPRGEGVLGIRFEGTLNDNMKGFYRRVYEHNGEKRNMAVTEFEPVDARRCFPCWDEPAFKAIFKITLEVPRDMVALSNMPIIEEKSVGLTATLSFQESPIMSTYLVAVVIGLFDYVEASTSDGIKVRVYCQVGKSSQGKFALDFAVKTLDLYKKYFAIPYSLPKLDMVAIPDFYGATENYGLVTYRETALLLDDQHSAASNKQRVAVVVAHELAHQWFGNLVTMEWWTHLWLNEGFATWVSYLAIDSLFPSWKVWTQFLADTNMGLKLDALAESHPIEVDINHASEIEEIFDAISYMKGASVIRMLQSYLGAECFQRSLASYIKRFAWSNANTEDLWTVLEEESGEPVKTLMNLWTKQKGYPVVSVQFNNGKLEIEQTQFLSSGSEGNGQWIVPITLCLGSYASQKKFLMKTKSEKLDVPQLSDVTNANRSNLMSGYFWIKLNVDQTGFYRVKYDGELAAALRHAIKANQLTSTDRFGILDDSFSLCMACKQTLSSLLSLMASFSEENEYIVLSLIIKISCKVADVAADATPQLLDNIKQFLINLQYQNAQKLSWDPKDGEGHLESMLRGELLTALVELGHDFTIDEAVRRFDAFLDDRTTTLLPPDTRKAAYVAMMQTCETPNKRGYESLLRIYRETDVSQEKIRILNSLASSSDPAVVLDALNFLLSSEVRSQDAIFGLVGINKNGRDVAWMWLKDNWDYISDTWGSGNLITRFISYIVSPLSSNEKAGEIEQFFASRTKPAFSRTLKQSIEQVRSNAKWVNSVRSEQSLGFLVEELITKQDVPIM